MTVRKFTANFLLKSPGYSRKKEKEEEEKANTQFCFPT